MASAALLLACMALAVTVGVQANNGILIRSFNNIQMVEIEENKYMLFNVSGKKLVSWSTAMRVDNKVTFWTESGTELPCVNFDQAAPHDREMLSETVDAVRAHTGNVHGVQGAEPSLSIKFAFDDRIKSELVHSHNYEYFEADLQDEKIVYLDPQAQSFTLATVHPETFAVTRLFVFGRYVGYVAQQGQMTVKPLLALSTQLQTAVMDYRNKLRHVRVRKQIERANASRKQIESAHAALVESLTAIEQALEQVQADLTQLAVST